MDDLRRTDLKDGLSTKDASLPDGTASAPAKKARQKPGPKKKVNPLSEKISCRLSKKEKAERWQYCREHGITPAELLRAAFLWATVKEASGKDKVIIDAVKMLHDLETLTRKFQERLDSGGKPVSAEELATIQGVLGNILSGVMALIPVAVCIESALVLASTDVVAKFGNVAGHRHDIVWLLGFISGALIDLVLFCLWRRYRSQITRFVAKGFRYGFKRN
ncbi:MAG TPA: hypothetical protein VMV79_01585, partial [Alphaproteobacteria bacterium]|nr:hypothetical protein [Alphaproteobacteria bacterium]